MAIGCIISCCELFLLLLNLQLLIWSAIGWTTRTGCTSPLNQSHLGYAPVHLRTSIISFTENEWMDDYLAMEMNNCQARWAETQYGRGSLKSSKMYMWLYMSGQGW